MVQPRIFEAVRVDDLAVCDADGRRLEVGDGGAAVRDLADVVPGNGHDAGVGDAVVVVEGTKQVALGGVQRRRCDGGIRRIVDGRDRGGVGVGRHVRAGADVDGVAVGVLDQGGGVGIGGLGGTSGLITFLFVNGLHLVTASTAAASTLCTELLATAVSPVVVLLRLAQLRLQSFLILVLLLHCSSSLRRPPPGEVDITD